MSVPIIVLFLVVLVLVVVLFLRGSGTAITVDDLVKVLLIVVLLVTLFWLFRHFFPSI